MSGNRQDATGAPRPGTVEDWDSLPVIGLTMSYAERLRWLEEAMEELPRICGAARNAPPLVERKPAD